MPNNAEAAVLSFLVGKPGGFSVQESGVSREIAYYRQP